MLATEDTGSRAGGGVDTIELLLPIQHGAFTVSTTSTKWTTRNRKLLS